MPGGPLSLTGAQECWEPALLLSMYGSAGQGADRPGRGPEDSPGCNEQPVVAVDRDAAGGEQRTGRDLVRVAVSDDEQCSGWVARLGLEGTDAFARDLQHVERVVLGPGEVDDRGEA